LKTSLSRTIQLVELDAHINDEAFALAAANLLMESLGASMERGQRVRQSDAPY
jgi:hypothetical protein